MAGAPKGNKNAAKPRLWDAAVRHELAKQREALYKIAANVIDKALAGEQWAVTEIRNTLDGKPKETVDITVEHHDREPVDELLKHLRPANPDTRTVN